MNFTIHLLISVYFSDSQTVTTKDEIQQTARDAATQVEIRNIYIQTDKDKFATPSEIYVSVDEIQTEHLTKVYFS